MLRIVQDGARRERDEDAMTLDELAREGARRGVATTGDQLEFTFLDPCLVAVGSAARS